MDSYREHESGVEIPIALAVDDWTTSDKIWPVDLFAPNRKLATAAVPSPIVAECIDAELLNRLQAL